MKSKPREEDFWDDSDPRGPSSSEIRAYARACEEWEEESLRTTPLEKVVEQIKKEINLNK